MDAGWRCSVTDAEVNRIAADIDRQGYGALADYISEEELEPLRNIAQTAVRESRGEYVHFTGLDAFAGTVLTDLSASAQFKGLCQRLYRLGTAETAPEVEFYSIVRCLQGATGQRNSYKFHYDSYVLTTLLPIVMPEEGARGDLVIIPRTRRIRRLYFSNLIDKALVDNSIAQAVLRMAAQRKRLNSISIRLRPGTIYFFWGYRSIHTNEPCDADKLRATALLHYGDPHRNSRARALIRSVRGMERGS
jgi:hypothetical protein